MSSTQARSQHTERKPKSEESSCKPSVVTIGCSAFLMFIWLALAGCTQSNVNNSNGAKSTGVNSLSNTQSAARLAASEWKKSREDLAMKGDADVIMKGGSGVIVQVLGALEEEDFRRARTLISENSSALADSISSLNNTAAAMRALPIPNGLTNPEQAKRLDELHAKMLEGKAKALSSLLDYGRTGQTKYLEAYLTFSNSEGGLESQIRDGENKVIAAN